MSIQRYALVLSTLIVFVVAGLAQPVGGQAGKSSLIVKLDADTLPEGARLRLGKLSGHRYTGQFTFAIMSADAKFVAVMSGNTGTVDILDVATNKTIQQLKTQAFGGVAGMSFSPDGKVLALETFGQDLRIWDIATGKQIQQFQHKNNGGGGNRQAGPSFSRDGKLVSVGNERFVGKENQGEIKAWEIATGKIFGPFSTLHNYNIRSALAPDGKTMISWGHYSARNPGGGADREIPRTIQVWDLAIGKEARQIKLDFGPQSYNNIVDVAFTPDGKSLAVTSGMSTNHIVDYETGKETRRFSGQRGNHLLRFSPDGQILATFDQYGAGSVQAWDMQSGKRIEISDGPKTQILSVGFPGNNKVTALGNLSGALIWWDATADESKSPFLGHLTPIVGLAYSADGKSIVTAGNDSRLLWWDAQTGDQKRELRLYDDDARYGGNPGQINTLTLSPDGRYAATPSHAGNGGVRLWNLKNGRSICDFEGPRSYSYPGMAFSPDSTMIAAAGSQYPMHIWNLQTGQEMPKMPAVNPNANAFDGGGGPSRVAFSPDGKRVAVHLNHYDRFTGQPISDLIVWDTVKSKEMHRLKVPMANFGGIGGSGNLAFSRDGRFFAISDGAGAITLYNTETGGEWRRISTTLRNSAFQLAFSGDGRFIAAGSLSRNVGAPGGAGDDSVIEIWELAGSLRRDQFKGHSSPITGLTFSPDGATLASASMDTTTLLWDLTGKSGPKVAPIAADDLPAAWKSLSGKDAAISMTMKRMAKSPEATLAFLEKHFLPIKGEAIEEKTIDALVTDLDSGNFRTREKASKELIRLGERSEPALNRGMNKQTTTVEARRRIQDILAAIVRLEYSPDELQAIRGVEVLERIGTPEAQQWLTTLSQGDSVAPATREARAVLKRMEVK